MLLGSTLGTGEREVFSIKGLFGEDRLIERKLQTNNVDVVITAIKTNRNKFARNTLFQNTAVVDQTRYKKSRRAKPRN